MTSHWKVYSLFLPDTLGIWSYFLPSTGIKIFKGKKSAEAVWRTADRWDLLQKYLSPWLKSVWENASERESISMARGQECSIFHLNMGTGCKSAAVTYIKGALLQTITSQEEETYCAAEKKELLSAKFPILLVISGLKMSAQDAFAQRDLYTLCSSRWRSISPNLELVPFCAI